MDEHTTEQLEAFAYRMIREIQRIQEQLHRIEKEIDRRKLKDDRTLINKTQCVDNGDSQTVSTE